MIRMTRNILGIALTTILLSSLAPLAGAAPEQSGELFLTELEGGDGEADESAVREKYHKLTFLLIDRSLTITTMESCVSGQLASLITDTEGSSAVLKGAFVTYSNEAKIRQGVDAGIIEKYGVYSGQTAAAMADACREAYLADIGVGVTGSFGNVDPNNADSVPGEVFFAISTESGTAAYHCTVPAQSSRLSYKLYMADVIADQLFNILSAG